MIVPNAELMPLLSEAILSRGTNARLTVAGTSMWPFVRNGDVVELAAVGDRKIAVDDLILARRDDGLYALHRVVQVSDEGIYLCGDAQVNRDGPLRREQCLAVVVAAWHKGRPLPLNHLLTRLTVRLWRWLTPCRPFLLAVLRRGWALVTGQRAAPRGSGGQAVNSPDSSMATLIALLAEGAVPEVSLAAVDWPAVIRCAYEQEVAPVLYLRLAALPGHLRPEPELMARLHAVYLHGAARNLRVAVDLGIIFEACHAAGVPIAPLKGSHLAFLSYADPAERVMGDLDLLVRPEDVSRARETLQALGYVQDAPHYGGAVDHLVFHGPAGTPIELHWTLALKDAPVATVDWAGVWARMVPATIGGAPVQVLSPADHIAYLCLHIYRHGFRTGLRRLLDIGAVVRAEKAQFDWAVVRATSVEWDCSRPVALVLAVVHDWFGLALSDDTLAWIDGEGANEQVARAQGVILNSFAPEVLPDCFVRMAGNRTLLDKARTGLASLFLSPKALAMRYGVPRNSPWLPFYYLRRIAEFSVRWGGSLLRLRLGHSTLTDDTSRRSDLLDWVDGRG